MTTALRGPLRKRESHLWEREEHDWYREPAWCSARLFALEAFGGAIHDPCCGAGSIVDSALAAGLVARGSDIVDRSDGRFPVEDALDAGRRFVNVVSNPPFALCNGVPPDLPQSLLDRTARKVALLLPATWMNGLKRSAWLEQTPLLRVWLIAPRPSMPTGHAIAQGLKPGSGTTDYAWFVWCQNYRGAPEIRWLRRDG